jgi:hypothetical protein
MLLFKARHAEHLSPVQQDGGGEEQRRINRKEVEAEERDQGRGKQKRSSS